MNSRELIRTIIAGGTADRTGLWLGNPVEESWPALNAFFGTKTEEELRRTLGDDFRWFCPEFDPGCYRHPDGLPMFDFSYKKTLSCHGGPFEECEEVADIENYNWPEAQYLDFSRTIAQLRAAGDVYRAGGMWCPFYHILMELFGMESYLMKMFTDPAVVHAATDRVCRFYYEANERFLQEAGEDLDAIFFGNDFGTQQDLICGPDQFDEFIMPWFRKFIALGKKYNKQVILHSCGAIHKVIDRIIDAEVDCLHPIQALAKNMDAQTLARDFRGRITFMGGIDTQHLLVSGIPEQVTQDVRRIRDLLGPRLIVSPSHEAVLANVPPENLEALSAAALEDRRIY
jgi:uroporphyrinogen decarboxylase